MNRIAVVPGREIANRSSSFIPGSSAPLLNRVDLLNMGGIRNGLECLKPSIHHIWVAARNSIPLTPAYVYRITDPPSCRFLRGSLTVEAKYQNGSPRDVTVESSYTVMNSMVARLSGHGTLIGVAPGSTMLNINYRGRSAGVVVHVMERSSRLYEQNIALLDAENNPRYQWKNGGSMAALQYINDLMRLMEADLPGKCSYSELLKWLSGNEAIASGWNQVSGGAEAQRLANDGHPSIVIDTEGILALCPHPDGRLEATVSGVLLKNHSCQPLDRIMNDSRRNNLHYFVHH